MNEKITPVTAVGSPMRRTRRATRRMACTSPTLGSAVAPRAAGGGPALVPFWQSLRAKGLLATLALLTYVLASVWYVSLERARILESVEALQEIAKHEKALALDAPSAAPLTGLGRLAEADGRPAESREFGGELVEW